MTCKMLDDVKDLAPFCSSWASCFV